MAKILVIEDAGHGLYTYGKRCLKSLDPNETREWILNDNVADELEERLNEYDDVEYVRLDDPSGRRDVPLSERVTKANALYKQYTAKGYIVIIISIHHNAGIYGGHGGGITNYIDVRNHSQRSLEIRDGLYDSLIAETGLKGNRATPKAKSYLYILYHTKMPGTLLELGFMDSPTDIKQILSNEHPVQCADAIVNFLVDEYGITKKVVRPAPTPIEDLAEYAYTTDNLNVRTGRSTGHKILATYPKGTKVKPLYLAKNWWSIGVPISLDKRGYGFVHADYLTKVAPVQPTNRQGVVNATRGLNVRSGPSTSYVRVGTLKNKTQVTIYAEQAGWYRIGANKWVSAKFVV